MDTSVQAVQRRLIALGYNVGTVGTDGILGNDTWKAINDALDKLEPPKVPQPMLNFNGKAGARRSEDCTGGGKLDQRPAG
ncbi:peptidoglycan-binding domain-containing protein [Rhizobium sp. A37_96]